MDRRAFIGVIAGGLLAAQLAVEAQAAERLTIVAVGASNTYGKGVSRADAYPAQLERILREDGLDVAVRNEGVNGETTDRMLNALPSTVPPGTHIVILQPGGNDSAMLSGDTRANAEKNVEKMVATLRERHVEVLIIPGRDVRGPGLREMADKYDALVAPPVERMAPGQRQADGEHFTPTGYRMIAERLAPLVKKLVARMHQHESSVFH